jgi:hypothetical protein
MITTRGAVSQIREYIGLPDTNKVGNGSIIVKMNNESNTMLAELNLTRDNESFKIKELPINAYESTYLINADNWGKPFYVESFDGGADPLYVPSEITITPVQKKDYFRSTDSLTVSFFSDDLQPKMIVTPVQEQSFWLKIYYEVESYVLALNDSPIPLRDAYMHLLIIRTARAVMPMTGHDDTAYHRLMNFLNVKEPQLNMLWTQQKLSQAAHSNERSYFGADREEYCDPYLLG